MKTYSAIVRPGGHITHEVPRFNLTPAEIVLLRTLHGDDAVVQIKEDGKSDITLKALRAHLERAYGPDKVADGFGKFGALPSELPDVAGPPDDDSEDDGQEDVNVPAVESAVGKRKTLGINNAA